MGKNKKLTKLSMEWFEFDYEFHMPEISGNIIEKFKKKYGIGKRFRGWSIDSDLNLYECECFIDAEFENLRCEDFYDVSRNGIGHEDNMIYTEWCTDNKAEAEKALIDILNKYKKYITDQQMRILATENQKIQQRLDELK